MTAPSGSSTRPPTHASESAAHLPSFSTVTSTPQRSRTIPAMSTPYHSAVYAPDPEEVPRLGVDRAGDADRDPVHLGEARVQIGHGVHELLDRVEGGVELSPNG